MDTRVKEHAPNHARRLGESCTNVQVKLIRKMYVHASRYRSPVANFFLCMVQLCVASVGGHSIGEG
jgi:hypothetical protein